MYNQIDLCYICLSNKKDLQHISYSHHDEITFYSKLTSSISEMLFEELNDQALVCKECCNTIDIIYDFRQKCLTNKPLLIDYIKNKYLPTNSSAVAPVNTINYKHEFKANSILFKLLEPKASNKDKESIIETRDNPVEKLKEVKIEMNYDDFLQEYNETNADIENANTDQNEQDRYDITLENQNNIPKDIEYINIKLENDLQMEYKNEEIEECLEEKNYDPLDNIYQNKEETKSLWTRDTWEQLYQKQTEFSSAKHVHPNQKPYEYTEYNKKLIKSRDPDIHMQIHTDKTQYNCNFCNQNFTQPYDLNKHMKTHSEGKPYECIICNKNFNQPNILTSHMRTHTEKKRFKCNQCRRKFAKISNLVKHIKTHTGEISFECNQCNKKFTKSSTLSNHMRIHTGEKPYDCNICSKSFTMSSTLYTHMQTHTVYTSQPRKIYECSTCSKNFTQSSHLTEHMRIHTGERPYECTLCDKKFTQSSHLTRHMPFHSRISHYECSMCDKKFKGLKWLQIHMQKHNRTN